MNYADNNCTCREVFHPDHYYVFEGHCVITQEPVSVMVPGYELFLYRHGKLIQDALQSVSKADREFLMTGISEAGWEALHPVDDDDVI